MRAGWARARIIRGLSGVPGAAAGGRGWSLGASEGVTATLPEVVKDIIRKINFEVYPSQVAGAGPVGDSSGTRGGVHQAPGVHQASGRRFSGTRAGGIHAAFVDPGSGLL